MLDDVNKFSKVMDKPMKHVLFLCTGNSARSVIAEGLLRHLGAANFMSHSAGSKPTGTPNPAAIAVLQANGIDTSFARSKSWHEFAAPCDYDIDIVITVCGNAADEICPIWPGAPVSAHWGVEDPADVRAPAEAVTAAFAKTFDQMHQRITTFLALDHGQDENLYRQALQRIGKIDDSYDQSSDCS